MTTRATTVLFCFIALLAQRFDVHASGAPEPITVCELTANPGKYHDRLIRVQATFGLSRDAGFLYDLRCNSPDAWVYYELEHLDVEARRPWTNMLKQRVARARVTLSGRYSGPNGFGYGHLGTFRHELVVNEFEALEPVVADEPWPSDVPGAAPIRDAERDVRALDLSLTDAVNAGDVEVLELILADDFIYTDSVKGVVYKEGFLQNPEDYCLPRCRELPEKGVYFTDQVKVFVFENLGVALHDVSIMDSPGLNTGETLRHIYATNVYERKGDKWKLVLMRASPSTLSVE